MCIFYGVSIIIIRSIDYYSEYRNYRLLLVGVRLLRLMTLYAEQSGVNQKITEI